MTHGPIPTPSMSRRRFLGVAAGTAALAAANPFGKTAWAKSCTATIPAGAIGIQLFTCTGLSYASIDATLTSLAQIGYKIVEHAGYGSAMDAKTFKSALDNAGLRCTSGHTGIPVPFDAKAWRTIVEDALVVGQKYIVGPSASAGTAAEWAALADSMNKGGAIARKEGIQSVGFHCHTSEWHPTSDDPKVRPIEILMERCDPSFTHIQMDIGWCYAASDPVKELRNFPGRFKQLHVKDMRKSPATLPVPVVGEGAPVQPGLGEVDFAAVFAAAKETRQPVKEFIVESDTSIVTCVDTAKLGYDLLSNMEYSYKC